jgi:hypothetical protein
MLTSSLFFACCRFARVCLLVEKWLLHARKNWPMWPVSFHLSCIVILFFTNLVAFFIFQTSLFLSFQNNWLVCLFLISPCRYVWSSMFESSPWEVNFKFLEHIQLTEFVAETLFYYFGLPINICSTSQLWFPLNHLIWLRCRSCL